MIDKKLEFVTMGHKILPILRRIEMVVTKMVTEMVMVKQSKWEWHKWSNKMVKW